MLVIVRGGDDLIVTADEIWQRGDTLFVHHGKRLKVLAPVIGWGRADAVAKGGQP